MTLAEFNAAPESVQDAFFEQLGERADAERRANAYLDWLNSDSPDSEEPLWAWNGSWTPSEPVAWDGVWTRRARAIRKARLHPEEDFTPDRDADPLVDIPARVYVEALTGEEVPRVGSMRCPLPDHDDLHPSFRVYDGAGWRCFGCVRSGTIYDLASILWGIEPRGEGFREIHKRLRTVFA